MARYSGVGLMAVCFVGVLAGNLSAQDRILPPPEPRTLVTIHGQKMTAADAAQQIATSSGVPITPADPAVWANAKDVTLNADNQPFWVVMQDFLTQAGLQAAATRAKGVPLVRITPAPPTLASSPQAVSGPFLFTGLGAVRTQAISYSLPTQIQDSTTLQIRALIDPQLGCVAYNESLVIFEATDDQGNSLVSPERLNAKPQMIRSDSEICSVDFRVPLDQRSPAAHAVKKFKGLARFQLMTKQDLWEVPDITTVTGRTKDFRGGKYTIGSLTPDPQNTSQYILALHVDWDPAIIGRSALASPLIELGSVRSAIQITDVAGRPLQMRGSNTRNGAQGSRDLNIYYFMAAPPEDPTAVASKLEWRIPTELITVDSTLELHDLPLP